MQPKFAVLDPVVKVIDQSKVTGRARSHRRVVPDSAVPPGVLRGPQRIHGGAEQITARRECASDQARADSQPQAVGAHVERILQRCICLRAQRLQQYFGVFGIDDPHERISLPPPQNGQARHRRQPPGELDQHVITRVRTVRLVDQGERVDVQHRDPAGQLGGDRFGDAALEPTPTRQPRELVTFQDAQLRRRAGAPRPRGVIGWGAGWLQCVDSRHLVPGGLGADDRNRSGETVACLNRRDVCTDGHPGAVASPPPSPRRRCDLRREQLRPYRVELRTML
ncbi:hypothetical protein GALL_345980 [mine drainage metagenome]|uniref:Uncharacterized protein n=1 Tax=mine drainage metagenome TaxID=410659 RepID=A0A1J5QJZ2_9ZZZZ